MPWDPSNSSELASGGSQSIRHLQQQQPQPQPIGSAGQSPKLRQRTASASSSTDSLVRQSLEFEAVATQQPQPQQQQQATARAAPVRAMLTGQQLHQPQLHQPIRPTSSDEAAVRSNSGPINQAAAAVSPSPGQSAPEVGARVKRTNSLKDDLIKLCRTTFNSANSSSSSNGGSGGSGRPVRAPTHHQAADRDPSAGDTRPTPGWGRQSHGNARPAAPVSAAFAATPEFTASAASTVATPVTTAPLVLPDKKLPGSRTGSSESLTGSDLTSLTQLVQRKRDRSHDSSAEPLDSPPRRPVHVRRATPTPPPQPSQTTTASGSGDSDGDLANGQQETSAVKLKPPTGRQQQQQLLQQPQEETPATDLQQQQQQQQHGSSDSASADASKTQSGHSRSSSYELLMQCRTQPKICQPSAIRKLSDAQQRDDSPSKTYGSSPPKVVSFNPTEEILTYEGGSECRGRGWSRRQQQQHRSAQLERMTDSALLDSHSAIVDQMEEIVAKQRMYLRQVQDSSITVASYRDLTRQLLGQQATAIHRILDTIQANEKNNGTD